MDVHELIASRRTVFQFDGRPVPEEAIWRAVEAARWAPNHKRTEPWRFTWAGPELHARFTAHFQAKMLRKLEAKGAPPEAIAKLRAEGPKVPAMLLVTQLLAMDEGTRLEDHASMGAAIQNLTLALWSEGIASGWKSFDDPTAHELAGVDPAQERIVGLLWLGYPAAEPPRGVRRLAGPELLRRSP